MRIVLNKSSSPVVTAQLGSDPKFDHFRRLVGKLHPLQHPGTAFASRSPEVNDAINAILVTSISFGI